jgi:serine/threonine protein kinase
MRWQAELSQVAGVADVRQRIQQYQALARAHPEAAAVWFNLAGDLLRVGDRAGAMGAAARALAVDPLMQQVLPAELRVALRGSLLPASLAGRKLGKYSVTKIVSSSETQMICAGRSPAGADVALRSITDVDDGLAKEELAAEVLGDPHPPGLVRVLDSFDAEDGRPWQVLEPLRGRSLAELSASGFLGLRTSLDVMPALARVIMAVHARDLVHGRLMPDVVFFEEDPAAKDPIQLLGVSRQPELPLHGLTPFRLRWLSPDVGTEIGVGRATDIYGLGMLLYFCLRGKAPPRLGQRLTIGLAQAQDSDTRALALDEILDKALALAPADRYASAEAFLAALERARSAPPAAPPKPASPGGERVVGRYRLVKLIGEGSFGAVYEAVHVDVPGKLAAVKLVLPEVSLSESAKQQFLDEANTAARIDDPHLVQLYDSGHLEDGSYYLVMELLRGKSLFDVLRVQRADANAPGLPVARTLKLTIQVASALRSAHAQNVVHRDLKPENLFVLKPGDDEFVKVLDFGIARLVGDNRGELASLLTGTPAYMPPEQWQPGGTIDPRSDVYSLGVILHECLAGQLPFPGPTVDDYRRQHAEVAPPPLAGAIPPPLRALIVKMLAKPLAERPASIDEVHRTLVSISEALGQPAPQPTRPLPSPPRRKWIVALVGVGLAVAIASTIALVTRDRSLPLDLAVSRRALTSAELARLTDDELQLLRYTPSARHGHRFERPTLRAYFEGRSWYHPVAHDHETPINILEKENVALIVAELNRRGVPVEGEEH